MAAVFAWALRQHDVVIASSEMEALAKQAKWLAMPLAVAIFWVMLKRGRSSELIKGASEAATPKLQAALLTNTVEQTLFAILSLLAFTAASPADLGAVVEVFVRLFCVGRLLFFVGYAIHPMWRFYGFSLNFYASVILLALAWWFSLSTS